MSIELERLFSTEPSGGARESQEPTMQPKTETPETFDLVAEVRRLRAEGQVRRAKRAEYELIRSMTRTVRRVAGRWYRSAGALKLEDLMQLGFIEVVLAIDTYEHSKRGTVTFESWVSWHANKAIGSAIRMHGQDVNVSDGASRGRTKDSVDGLKPRVKVVSADARASSTRSRSMESAEEHDDSRASIGRLVARTIGAMEGRSPDEGNPEPLVLEAEREARLYEALQTLSADHQDILGLHYGLQRNRQGGSELRGAQSLHDLALRYNESRTKVTSRLKAAQRALASALSDLVD
jgi:RNA polymerase sigma factor (sigma-70 family)